MGFHSVNDVQISRDYKTREIIVKWYQEYTREYKEQRFPWDQSDKAFALAASEFNSLSM